MIHPWFFAALTCSVLRRAAGDQDPIALYTPVSDVVEHSEIDLDMQELEAGADEETESGFEAAWTAYAVGGNSVKSEGEIRTIRGFSTSAQEKLSGEFMFDIYEDYWGDPAYADAFTTSACNGTGAFESVDSVIRAEGCVKGAQYQNVWMYVIHELEDAINDCENDDLTDNDGGPHAWDEGWAFYAGSLEGTDGEGDGLLLYALADKRCENFGTCTGDDDGSSITGTSAINSEIRELFDEGMVHLQSRDCDSAAEIKNKIIVLMTVPLVQGLLRYVYYADPEGGQGAEKEAAELWAFSASVLPQLHNCDNNVAAIILSNTDIASTSAPISDGYVSVKAEIESLYDCLGITCEQVGGLLLDESEYFVGMEPCGQDDDGGFPGYGVAIIVIAIVLIAALVAGFICIRRRRAKKSVGESDLGGFGAKTATTL